MVPYIFMEKNGTHILDLNQTAAKLDEGLKALNKIAKMEINRKLTKDIESSNTHRNRIIESIIMS